MALWHWVFGTRFRGKGVVSRLMSSLRESNESGWKMMKSRKVKTTAFLKVSMPSKLSPRLTDFALMSLTFHY